MAVRISPLALAIRPANSQRLQRRASSSAPTPDGFARSRTPWFLEATIQTRLSQTAFGVRTSIPSTRKPGGRWFFGRPAEAVWTRLEWDLRFPAVKAPAAPREAI